MNRSFRGCFFIVFRLERKPKHYSETWYNLKTCPGTISHNEMVKLQESPASAGTVTSAVCFNGQGHMRKRDSTVNYYYISVNNLGKNLKSNNWTILGIISENTTDLRKLHTAAP